MITSGNGPVAQSVRSDHPRIERGAKNMRVKMLISVSGTRNGVDWPLVGGEIDLPPDEAADLCEAGYASPVKKGAESAAAPSPPENAAKKTATRSPRA